MKFELFFVPLKVVQVGFVVDSMPVVHFAPQFEFFAAVLVFIYHQGLLQ
jgi:hypothetical protein